MNLYAFVHNDPLTHFDEYGLLDFGQYERGWQQRSKAFNTALVHEVGSQILNTGRFVASIPYYLTGGNFFGNWQAKQNQWFDRAENWMHRAFPFDQSNSDYQSYRNTFGWGSLAVGGYGVFKGGISLGKKVLPYFSRSGLIQRNYAVNSEITGFSKDLLLAKKIESIQNGFSGFRGFELKNAKYQNIRNEQKNIRGRLYGGHALDQMQNRGITPSIVEQAIQNNSGITDKIPGRIKFYDPINRVSVIIENEKVITVWSCGK